MSIQKEEEEILDLWHKLSDDMHHDLANLWLNKDKLPVLTAEIETLEAHVLKLIKILPDLKRHNYREYRANCDHLIGYLNHPQASKEWVKEMQKFMDLVLEETNDAIKRAKIKFTSRKLAVLEPMFKIIKLITDFYRRFNLDNLQIIEQRLKANGLEILQDDYKIMKIFNALKSDGPFKPLSQSEIQITMENLLADNKIQPYSDLHKFVIQWTSSFIKPIQLLIEALPRETGLVDLQHSDSASDLFHEYLTEMYASVGIKYYPLRLYRDDFNSPNAEPVMKHTHSAYRYGRENEWDTLAAALFKLMPDIHHGSIIRVSEPSYYIPRGDKDSRGEWKGVFEILFVRNK